jgi:hypothetical protein
MRRFILTNPNLFPSARCIRDSIEVLTGEHIVITTEPTKRDVVLRWGTTMITYGKDAKVNTARIVSICSNKILFSRSLEGTDVWTPQFCNRTPIDSEYPILVRTTLTGFGGVGIIPCRNAAEYAQHTGRMWTRYFDLASEFRVHVAGGEILRVFKKINEGADTDNIKIRNMHRGWKFSIVENFSNMEVLKLEISRLWDILNFEGGICAFDLGWSKTKHRYLVLEGNSAPGVSENDNTLECYVRHILRTM